MFTFRKGFDSSSSIRGYSHIISVSRTLERGKLKKFKISVKYLFCIRLHIHISYKPYVYIVIFDLQVHSYTHLNWRLLGSLLLEVTFEGESTFPQTPQPTLSTDLPTTPTESNPTEDGRTEELRLKKIVEEKAEDKGSSKQERDTNSFLLYKESIDVIMHAELMVEEDLDSDYDIGEREEDRLSKSRNTSNMFSAGSQIFEYDETTWVKKHVLDATRQLQCTFSHTKRKFTWSIIRTRNLNIFSMNYKKVNIYLCMHEVHVDRFLAIFVHHFVLMFADNMYSYVRHV